MSRMYAKKYSKNDCKFFSTSRSILALRFFYKALLGGIIFLPSCVSMTQDEQRQNILFPPCLETSISKSLETDYFSVGNWPEEKWWKIFDTEQLDAFVAKALKGNPSLQAIEQRIELAKQTATVTGGLLFPLISFDAKETWELLSKNGVFRALNPKLPLNVNVIDLTLSSTYEFDFWGKNRNLFNAAMGRMKAEEAEAVQVELIITTSIAQTYFALKTNLLKEQLYLELVAVRKEIFQLESLLREKALFSALPPLLSEENVWEIEQQLLAIQEEIATYKHLLNILMGSGPDEHLEIDHSLPPLPSALTLPENLSIDLLSRRPDLMAQIWRVEALAHEVGAAKADFYPNISLTSFAGLQSALSFPYLFDSGSKTFGLQPAIHLPIFTAGAIRANIRAKKASFDDAVYTYNNLLLQSAQEVADLLVLIQMIFTQKDKQDSIVQNAEERYQLTLLRQRSGLDNQLENYAFKEALIEKKLTDVELVYGQYLAAIKLIKALGGGYQSEYSLPLQAGSCE